MTSTVRPRSKTGRIARAGLAALLAAAMGLTAAFAATHTRTRTRVIPDDFPQKDDSWAEPSPKPVRRDPVGSYPFLAQQLGLTGSTTIIFWIDEKGRVTRPLVASSNPAGFFEANCLDYVRSFTYGPQHKIGVDDVQTRRWSYTCTYKLD